jgi:hypothetical protein
VRVSASDGLLLQAVIKKARDKKGINFFMLIDFKF